MADSSRDSGPLEPNQLSDDELRAIHGIGSRLAAAQAVPHAPTPRSQYAYLADTQDRQSRVLLLDGGRGTGKTSMLLTLVHRWAPSGKNYASYGDPIGQALGRDAAASGAVDADARDELDPTRVRVLPILDFDPLPPGMPLIAAIVEAWRPLAEAYDKAAGCDAGWDDKAADDGETLMDRWRRLFQVAAVGWTGLPTTGGLLEQVLDRQEQVQDWRNLDRNWREFVDEVIKRGETLKGTGHRVCEPLFVIMIDDVDLQVSRIRELLPALRLLYHQRVFFIVAADSEHLLGMLKLDFLGQQNGLANHVNAEGEPAARLAHADRWAPHLAKATFEKVFPPQSRWQLKKLSTDEFLAFPRHPSRGAAPLLPGEQKSAEQGSSADARAKEHSFGALFGGIARTSQAQGADKDSQPVSYKNVAELIANFAQGAAREKLPGVMTYRGAHQLLQYVNGPRSRGGLDALAGLLSGISEGHPASVQDPTRSVEVLVSGELSALYRRGLTEFGGHEIVLSSQPDFVFVPGEAANKTPVRMSSSADQGFGFTAALIAKALEEAGFPVDATALRWETYLSLAWTEWPLSDPPRDPYPRASFSWTRHRHPRPDDLLRQTRDWNEFARSVDETSAKIERFAYAWIYFQRTWSSYATSDDLHPKRFEASLWPEILKFKINTDGEADKWLGTTIPLLARPELGFPPEVAERLLEVSTINATKLTELRRRLVTDALLAAAAQRGDSVGSVPEDMVIDNAIAVIEKAYAAAHGVAPPWQAQVTSAPASLREQA